MSSLFGVELPTAVNFVIAFVVVLVLIGATAWLVRRLGGTQLEAAARNRQPRLAVIDSASVDNRRKLVIIRRDNVEHLLMIGGPSDVVVETNIVRAGATRDVAPARAGNGDAGRALPLSDPWPLQPEAIPPVPQPARTQRTAAEESEAWEEAPVEPVMPPAPALRAMRPADTLAGLAAELSAPPRGPHPEHAAASVPVVAPADQSLAEMAQRLEAALRRPAPPRMAVDTGQRPVATEAKPAVRSTEPRIEPRAEPGPRAEPRAASAAAAKPSTQTAAQPKQPPGNLEKEMASLLSRPGKT